MQSHDLGNPVTSLHLHLTSLLDSRRLSWARGAATSFSALPCMCSLAYKPNFVAVT